MYQTKLQSALTFDSWWSQEDKFQSAQEGCPTAKAGAAPYQVRGCAIIILLFMSGFSFSLLLSWPFIFPRIPLTPICLTFQFYHESLFPSQD